MATEATVSKAAADLADEVRRLEAELAKERPGTCVYAVGDKAHAAQMTELSCALLNGTWIDGAVGSRAELTATAEAMTEALQRKLSNSGSGTVETGVCVYVAGGAVCQAETSAYQCDLIAGQWFRVSKETLEKKEK